MTPEQVAMTAFAASRLDDGRTPAQAFADLAGAGLRYQQAALAVCVAAGTPAEDAVARVSEFAELWPALDDTEPGSAGELLEGHGVFDVEVALDEVASQAASYLRQAISAAGWFPSGQANAIHRMLRTGRLVEALVALEEIGAKRWLDNRPFWAALVRAGDTLSDSLSDAPGLAEVRRRCFERA